MVRAFIQNNYFFLIVFERLAIKGLKKAGIQSHRLCFIHDKGIYGGLARGKKT